MNGARSIRHPGRVVKDPLFTKVRDICNSLVNRYRRAGLVDPANGFCADCGSSGPLCYDHRTYDDPLAVETVCYSCNGKRGAAALTILDIETLRRVPYEASAS